MRGENRSYFTIVVVLVTGLAVAGLSLPSFSQSGLPPDTKANIILGQETPKPSEEKKDEKKKEEEKPFDEVVKDMEKIEGLFTYYRNADENKVLLELRPDQLDKDYTVMGFEAKTSINREDFGITWNNAFGKKQFMVGKHLDIVIHVEADLQAE